MANSASSSISKDRPRLLKFRSGIFQRELLLLIFILFFIVVSSFLSPYFFELNNFQQIMISIALDTVVAIGMTVVLVGGGIDLSVGSTIGLCSVVVGLSFAHGYSIPVSILLALFSGLVVGLINGYLVSYVSIEPIIVTLGMMTIARSGNYILSGGYPLAAIPVAYKAFASGNLIGIPKLFIVAIILVILFSLLMSKNVFFRKYYFIGGNEAAAFRAGIKVRQMKLASYVISSLAAALAAILLVSRLGSSFPHTGLGTEMRVISACVIGGCSVSGGKGTVIGALLGTLLLGLINDVLVLTGVNAYWQGVVSGLILIFAVTADALINRRKA